MKKRKSFLTRLALALNLFLLLLQLMTMDVLGLGLEIPILSLGVPLLCLLNVVFFVFWTLRLKWPALLFLIAVAWSFESWQLLYQFKSKGIITSKGLHVMSYNVRSFNRFNWLEVEDVPTAITNFVETTDPDVVCFQEYAKDNAPLFKKYPYQVFLPYLPNGRIGSCIISKYPIFNSKKITFDASKNGGMQSDLVWKQDTLRLYNIHFESLRIDSKDTLFSPEYSKKFNSKLERVFELQKKQVAQFEALASTNRFPEILCTDLNNNAFSTSYKTLTTVRKDAYKDKGKGFGATYQFSYFPLRIDYILTAPNFKIIDFQTHDVVLSDHKPISAQLGWP
jgi:vancomycin resistance protein VanJ